MRIRGYLFGLLILLVGLLVGLFLGGYRLQDFNIANAVSIDKEQIDSLYIDDEGQNWGMNRQGARWIFSDYFDLTVEQTKVDRLFSYLSPDSPKSKNISEKLWRNLKNDKEDLDCRVVFKEGKNELASILFFDNSEPQNDFVLGRTEDTFFIIPAEKFPYSTEQENWMDKKMLQFNAKNVESIELQDILLVREKGEFILADLEANEKTNTSEIQKLLGYLAQIKVEGISPMSDRPFGEERIQEIWIDFKNKPIQYYVIYRNEKLDYDQLKTSEYQCQFKLTRSITNYLQNLDREDLLRKNESKNS